MSGKREYNKWFKTYRTVTEVDFQGVDQWEDGDVEIAFMEGYWSGRRDSILWVVKTIGTIRAGKSTLLKKAEEWQNKLYKTLKKRGNREEIGGVIDEEPRDYKDPSLLEKKNKSKSMTEEVAFIKFDHLTKDQKIEVMENALGYMSMSNSQTETHCIARGVACVLEMELR